MNLKLLNTTVFRLSLVYALGFSLIATAAIGVIYWWVAEQIQLQTDERLQLETRLLLDQYRESQLEVLFQLVERKKTEGRASLFIYAVIPNWQRDLTHGFSPDYTADDGKLRFATLPLGEVIEESNGVRRQDPVRVLLTLLPGGYQLLVGQDLNEQKKLLSQILWMVIAAIVGTVLLAVTGGALMGYGVLKRIDAVRETAGEIIEGDLTQRMPVTERDDEFDRLSRVLNRMLHRLEQLMQGMREVSDNLAHDLRNPLNRLRTRIEVTLMEPREQSEYRRILSDTLEDADGLINTFNALLSIARAEAGVSREDWGPVNLTHLIDEMGELYEVVAEEQNIQFEIQRDNQQTLRGHRQLLAQALTNLLDNAFKFTPAGGSVQLTSVTTPGGVEIFVSDSGPGIAAADRERVFERFTRLDSSRSTPGSGLGLSLVKAVLNLHDGEIELQDNHPGLRVLIRFPVEVKQGKKLKRKIAVITEPA